MKKLLRLAVLTVLLSVLTGTCQNAIGPEAPGGGQFARMPAVIVPHEEHNRVALLAGRTIDAGRVVFRAADTDGDGVTDSLVVVYSTHDGWRLEEVHFWIDEDLATLPVTLVGNPVPGRFPHTFGELAAAETWSFGIPFASLGMAEEAGEHRFHAAAHAVVTKDTGEGGLLEETAWAEGERIVEQGNWATRFEVAVTRGETSPGSAETILTLPLGTAWGVSVSDGYAYVHDGSGLCVIDVGTPESARVVHTLEAPSGGGGFYKGVHAVGDYAYLAGGDAGLYIIAVNPPESAHVVATVATPGPAAGVWVSEDYAYVAAEGGGLAIVRIDPPESAHLVATVPTAYYARRVHVVDGYAYVAGRGGGDGGLEIFAVDPPESAHRVASVRATGASGVHVADGRAYLADRSGRLAVFAVDPPDSPEPIAEVALASAWGVTVAGGYAYVAAGPYLRIVDIRDTAGVDLIHSVYVPDAVEVAVSGAYAYLGSQDRGLTIVRLW